MGRSLAILLLLLGVAAAEPPRQEPVRAADLDRIRELYRLTDTFGEKLWPGFDARKVPICLNIDDKREILLAHSDPPAPFQVLSGHDLRGTPILIRDGCSLIGPGRGGWATNVYGLYLVYMSAMQPGNHTENCLSVFLHECFHVYQRRIREPLENGRVALPRNDATYCALIGLEARILHAAVKAADDDEARAFVRMFLAVRRERRTGLGTAVIRTELEDEYNEGTAKYVQVRLVQLLSESGGLERQYDIPLYAGFNSAEADHERFLQEILPKGRSAITFLHAMYNVGMAQCLLLDRFRPAWKAEMCAKDSSMTELLERQFPAARSADAKLVAAAKERFDYVALHAGQVKIIERELSAIRRLFNGPGRRYRIYAGTIPGHQKRKTRGRCYVVPESLRSGRGRTTIWTLGMWLQKGDLTLTTQDVPIIVHPGYLEWIDREPAADGSDMKIEYARRDRSVYEGLRVTTDGFVLEMGRATIRKSVDIVSFHPAGRRGR